MLNFLNLRMAHVEKIGLIKEGKKYYLIASHEGDYAVSPPVIVFSQTEDKEYHVLVEGGDWVRSYSYLKNITEVEEHLPDFLKDELYKINFIPEHEIFALVKEKLHPVFYGA